eukprot:TRINITY_DN1117_c0_g1_i2.p2 TRINITY_DN1117_c0_g1~~TRINITY_DN1117_c0_g1_i2.p2  ORF type:complete len:269 (-),score=76.87 TRINITY_DN1117_c0_g1_i2:1256-2062(-)
MSLDSSSTPSKQVERSSEGEVRVSRESSSASKKESSEGEQNVWEQLGKVVQDFHRTLERFPVISHQRHSLEQHLDLQRMFLLERDRLVALGKEEGRGERAPDVEQLMESKKGNVLDEVIDWSFQNSYFETEDDPQIDPKDLENFRKLRMHVVDHGLQYERLKEEVLEQMIENYKMRVKRNLLISSIRQKYPQYLKENKRKHSSKSEVKREIISRRLSTIHQIIMLLNVNSGWEDSELHEYLQDISLPTIESHPKPQLKRFLRTTPKET